jgi:cell division initiation protein
VTRDPATRLEPVEIQHVMLRRRLFGYRRRDVDDLLETVSASFEEVWYEREALRDRVETLLDEMERAGARDRLLGDVVRNAQRVAEQTIADARETAEGVLAKARRRAQELVADAQREPERLREEIRGLTIAERALHERFRAFSSVVARDVLAVDEGFNDAASPDGRHSGVAVPEQDASSTTS